MRVGISHIEEYIEKILPKKRLKHTYGVRETALKLAEFYGCDTYKAEAAALLHDAGKYLHKEELIGIIKFEDKNKKKILEQQPEIYHGHASAIMAERDLGIHDGEILDAVKFHTTGREDMSLLEKIIYIADYIEPNRDFPGVDKIRKMVYLDLDRSIYYAMNNTMAYITERDGIIDFDTLLARNYFLMKWGKECERPEKAQK